jgi:hypothetical protein
MFVGQRSLGTILGWRQDAESDSEGFFRCPVDGSQRVVIDAVVRIFYIDHVV